MASTFLPPGGVSENGADRASSTTVQADGAGAAAIAADDATEVYLDLLLQDIDDFAVHLQPLRKYAEDTSATAGADSLAEAQLQHPIAGPSWTELELDLFHRAISRYSKLRPDLIAKEVRTKTLVQVCLYIKALEQGVSEVTAAELEAATQHPAPMASDSLRRELVRRRDQRRRNQRRRLGTSSTRSGSASSGVEPADVRFASEEARTPHQRVEARTIDGSSPVVITSPDLPSAHRSAALATANSTPLQGSSDSEDFRRAASSEPARKRARGLREALAQMQERRWRLLPASREMDDDWIEFEEAQAAVLTSRTSVVSDRLATVAVATDCLAAMDMTSATSDKGAGTAAVQVPEGTQPISDADRTEASNSQPLGFPTYAEKRAMALYCTSLPISFDEQVAATMLFLRHRRQLEPGRRPNVVLLASPHDQEMVGPREPFSMPLRAFKLRHALRAVFDKDQPIVSETYINFCTSHPAAPMSGQQDVLRALIRGVELGFLLALDTSEAATSSVLIAKHPGKRKKVVSLYGQAGTSPLRSTSISSDAVDSLRQVCFSWADTIRCPAMLPQDQGGVADLLRRSAERGRHLFGRARAEARARLLASLTPLDLWQSFSAHDQVEKMREREEQRAETQQNGSGPAAEPEGRQAAGQASSSTPTAAERPEEDEPSPCPAVQTSSDGVGPPKASNATIENPTTSSDTPDRLILAGQDMGIDLSGMTQAARDSVARRLSQRLEEHGLASALTMASHFDRHGDFHPNTSFKRQAAWIYRGQDMGIDLTNLPIKEAKLLQKRVRKHAAKSGMKAALEYCAKLNKALTDNLAFEDYGVLPPRSLANARKDDRLPPIPAGQSDSGHDDDGVEDGDGANSQNLGDTEAEDEPGSQEEGPDDGLENEERGFNAGLAQQLRRKRLRGRLVEVGLAEGTVLNSPSPSTTASEAGPVVQMSDYGPALCSKELAQALAVFPGVIQLLESEPDPSNPAGPRRVHAEVLESLLLHLRSFLGEIIFSITTTREPYSLVLKTVQPPAISGAVVRSAIARLGYLYAMPGTIDAVKKKQTKVNSLEKIDWEAEVLDEFGRKAMMSDPPVCYTDVLRPRRSSRVYPDLLDSPNSDGRDSDGTSASRQPHSSRIDISVEGAHRLEYPRSQRRHDGSSGREEAETVGGGEANALESNGQDEGLTDFDVSDLSSLSSQSVSSTDKGTSTADASSDGEDDGSSHSSTSSQGQQGNDGIDADRDDSDRNRRAEEHGTANEDGQGDAENGTVSFDLDPHLIADPLLRDRVERIQQLEASHPQLRTSAGRLGRYRTRLMARVQRDLDATERVEIDVHEALDREDNAESLLYAEELFWLLRGGPGTADGPGSEQPPAKGKATGAAQEREGPAQEESSGPLGKRKASEIDHEVDGLANGPRRHQPCPRIARSSS